MELRIENLTKKYGEKVALQDFSYIFTPGIYGILGANGAGKSTLMNLITDNVKRNEGRILWDGQEILKLGVSFRAQLGYMPQQQGMYSDFSARAFLRYMAQVKGLKRKQANTQIEELLELVNLKEDAHKKLGGFSGGMRQRVLLAQALLGEPRIMILDEPTAGLDPKERLRLRNYIADLAEDRIVFLTTHIVSDIESIATDVLLMKNGVLVKHGTPEELIAEIQGKDLEDVYMAYLGVD
ncbi:MAG: ATP-binding cassette domain-containing protein [Oscillospiraceae bacterium]|nr:ATP-binding cassette domain-containing protein [Oscillospiraceae bacterium]